MPRLRSCRPGRWSLARRLPLAGFADGIAPYTTIALRLSTEVTPGADHAARSASSFSAQERTVPFRMTLLPSTSTAIRRASEGRGGAGGVVGAGGHLGGQPD